MEARVPEPERAWRDSRVLVLRRHSASSLDDVVELDVFVESLATCQLRPIPTVLPLPCESRARAMLLFCHGFAASTSLWATKKET